MKTKFFKNGAFVTFERLTPSGMYAVLLRSPSGDVSDKVRCDDYRDAMAYMRSFCAIAKAMK
jgi:hypothetical protein